MTYTKTAWVDGGAPAITAANLNKIEQGIADAHTHMADTTNPHNVTADQIGALSKSGGTISGDLTVTGTTKSTIDHTNGYMLVRPYNASYDDGSYVKSYYNGDARKWFVFRDNDAGTATTAMDIVLGGNRVYHAGNITRGTGSPSGGQDGDIYIKY